MAIAFPKWTLLPSTGAWRPDISNGGAVLLSPELTEQVVQDRVSPRAQRRVLASSAACRAGQANLSHLLRLSDGAYRCHAQFSWKGIRSCNMGVGAPTTSGSTGLTNLLLGGDMRTRILYCGCTMRAWFARTGFVPPRCFTCGTAKPPERRSRKTPARCENAPHYHHPAHAGFFATPHQ